MQLGLFPPPAQLEVDELPHHEGLSGTDGGKHRDPVQKHTVTHVKGTPSSLGLLVFVFNFIEHLKENGRIFFKPGPYFKIFFGPKMLLDT